MRNNHGFSLIELIVVVSIIALLTGGTAISIRLLSYTDTEKITNQIDQHLRKLRMDTMSTGDLYHYLFLEWDGVTQEYHIGYVTGSKPLDVTNWRADGTLSNEKRLGSNKIKISYTDYSDGSGLKEIGEINSVVLFQYYVHSGAFQSDCRMISIENGSRQSNIHLVGKTGKHYTS